MSQPSAMDIWIDTIDSPPALFGLLGDRGGDNIRCESIDCPFDGSRREFNPRLGTRLGMEGGGGKSERGCTNDKRRISETRVPSSDFWSDFRIWGKTVT
jgi:hypothetical protein